VLGSKQDLPAPFGPAYVHMPSSQRRRGLWLGLTALLVLATLANAAWTFREQLESVPQVRGLLSEAGLLQQQSPGPYREPGQIHVVSRDLHSHPTRAGILVLSATFVNHADRAQAWPRLELTLLDIEGKAVARRRFSVDEYLPGRGSAGDLFRSRVHAPVLIEFSNPGDQAVGFEIRFL
jgi:hypothetical protein